MWPTGSDVVVESQLTRDAPDALAGVSLARDEDADEDEDGRG